MEQYTARSHLWANNLITIKFQYGDKVEQLNGLEFQFYPDVSGVTSSNSTSV